MSKIVYLTYDTSLHLVTSLLVRNVKLKNDIDVIDYFAGDNEIYDWLWVQTIDIADILGEKYRYRIDIGNGNIDPPVVYG